MNHVMLDLETMGTDTNSVILSIGAIKFTKGFEHKEDDNPLTFPENIMFHKKITTMSCISLGMAISKDTMNWWHKQSIYNQKDTLFSTDCENLYNVLVKFTQFFKGSTFIWGNGSSFDVSILENAYKLCGLEIPWKYYDVRDLRTLYDLANLKSYHVPNRNKHNPVNDCHSQILGYQMCMKKLKLI